MYIVLSCIEGQRGTYVPTLLLDFFKFYCSYAIFLIRKMLIPAFRFNLRNTVLESLVTVGKCFLDLYFSYNLVDGKHPSLACGTNAGKIFIHSPHRSEDQENEIRYLNINQQITTVASGKVENNLNEILFVGTQTNVLA